MADLHLELKDVKTIPNWGCKKILEEARTNHNTLVEAILALNNTLKEISEKLEAQPDLARSIDFNADSIKDVQEQLLPAMMKKGEENLSKVKAEVLVEVDKNSGRITDLEGHSRRRNLIINGVKEVANEKIVDVARKFMREQLLIDENEVNGFLLRDVHRLKKPKPVEGKPDYPKPIIIAFLQQNDRNSVMKQAFNLKGTAFSIKSDLPKSLNDIRQKMLKEKFRLKGVDPRTEYRVAERGYKPIFQKCTGTKTLASGDTVKTWEDTLVRFH